MHRKKPIKPKLFLLGNSLSNGGAEKVHSLLSVGFENDGFDVINVLVNRFDNEFEFSGKMINLNKSKGLIANMYLFVKLIITFLFSSKGYIIDHRVRSSIPTEKFLKLLFKKHKYFPVVHSDKIDMYFTGNSNFAKKHYKVYNVVVVSNGIKNKIERELGIENITVINNPVNDEVGSGVNSIAPFSDFNFILGVGRMEHSNIKQHDIMIKAFFQSKLYLNNIKLVLLGDGPARNSFEKLAKEYGIEEHVIFKGFVKNTGLYFKNALFTLLTSKFEGLPNVIIESLYANTPVISYDCPSGPKELIRNNINGILVENANFDELVSSMIKLHSDTILFDICKSNARKSVEKFELSSIIESWNRLFELNKL